MHWKKKQNKTRKTPKSDQFKEGAGNVVRELPI
jgi:hypothetical protein